MTDSENFGSWKTNTFVLKMQCLGSFITEKTIRLPHLEESKCQIRQINAINIYLNLLNNVLFGSFSEFSACNAQDFIVAVIQNREAKQFP